MRDLADERETVRQSILKLRLVPVMFEAGARPHPARDLYQAYLSQSHVFIGIYWQSYGWVGPGMDVSGLEDEYNLSANLPRLIYIKAPAESREPRLDQMLERIKQENSLSYKRFSSQQELSELIENDLALLLTESYEAAERNTVEPQAELSRGSISNLPIPRNPLLGRDEEMQVVRAWLSEMDYGLVTLTGTAGVGKSRLGLQAAFELRDRFPDGTFLVRLTPVKDPGRVLHEIAETLGLSESPGGVPATDLLIRFLRGKQLLLLLDNFEHLLAAGPELSKFLEEVPGVKVLATSRAPLRLRGERELRIQTLPVPDSSDSEDIDRLGGFASVALFMQRVQSFRPGFALTSENAESIAMIVNRLEGMPLALELAAARLRLLSPRELLKRLKQRFEVLQGGTRDLPEHQRTLRSAIDWSYDLLPEEAKALFRRLAVFCGGWVMASAEAVGNLNGDMGSSVLQALEVLVDSNLVSPGDGQDGLPRFGMLQSLRDYALERLVESGELEAVSRLHAERFLRFVEVVEPRVRSADRMRWQRILEDDFANIRAALTWASTHPEGVQIGQRMTIALAYYWAICGERHEGLEWCERFSELMTPDTPIEIRSGLLGVAGGIALVSGEPESVVSSMLESLDYARQSGKRQLLANVLLWTGAWALTLKSLSVAWDYLQESLALFRDLGDEWSEVLALNWSGYVAYLRGDKYLAEVLTRQSLAVAREQGDPWALVFPLLATAQRQLAVGDMASGESTLLEIEGVSRAVGDNADLAWSLNGLGQVRLARADVPAAKKYFSESLRLARDNGNKPVMVMSLLEAAVLVTLRLKEAPPAEARWSKLELDSAARLCGVTEAVIRDPTVLRRTGARAVYEAMLVRVRGEMDPDEWDCGYAEGAKMSLEKALDLAARELEVGPARD